MAAGHYKTFEIASPVNTHFKRISCSQADCQRRLKGWDTILDVSDPKHASVANWIRLQSGKRFMVKQVGTVVTFSFPPGQDCFEPHQKSLERPELFVVREGDWRGNPRQVDPYVHKRPEDWVDQFANHQQSIADAVQQG